MAQEFSWMTPEEFQSAIDEQLMKHSQPNSEQLPVDETATEPLFHERPIMLTEDVLLELRTEARAAGVLLPESDDALRQWVIARDEEQHFNY